MTTTPSGEAGSSSRMARSGVMPMPAPMSTALSLVRTPAWRRREAGAGGADGLGRDPERPAVGGGGEGVRVAPGPPRTVEEAPLEELAGTDGQAVEPAPRHDDRRDGGRLGDDL